MGKVGIKAGDEAEKRNFYKDLKKLRNPLKNGTIKFVKIGRKKVNYLPENWDLVKEKWHINDNLEKRDDHLEIKIFHTKDIQVKVIEPLYNRFKKILYGWEFSKMNDNERKFSAEKGAFYCEVNWGGEKGMHIDIYHKVKSTVLLDDYLQFHAPALATMIEHFDEEYNEFWKKYYEIHERIQKIIISRMGLPIKMYSLNGRKGSLNYCESVTTNLQYKLADYVIYGNAFNNNYLRIPFSVKEHNKMFESWFSDENPEKCFLKEKCRGQNKKAYHNQIDQKLHTIFGDIKKSVKLHKSSDKIQRLRDNLWEHQYEIVRNLEKDLNKKVLDGICDFCTFKNEAEKEKRKEPFDMNILHQYFHDHD